MPQRGKHAAITATTSEATRYSDFGPLAVISLPSGFLLK
jgi:hypothetical protein